MRMDASKQPVIIGVGQVNDRPEDPFAGLDSLGLMQAALRVADKDAGGGWLPHLDSIAVVDQISFPALGFLPDKLAALLGATPKICEQTPIASGDSPILLLNQAANRIATGEIKLAAIVGGEALRTAARRAAANNAGSPDALNAVRSLSSKQAPSLRQRYGLVAPTDVYPLYENAGRAAYGQTLAEAQAETGEIWAAFSQVATENPGAWLRKPFTAAQICAPSADNRPLAFPYLKLMVANSSVNQGAGFLVTSLAMAREAGVPEAQIIYVGHGAAAHEPDDFLARDTYSQSASMVASLEHALLANEVRVADLDYVELYSCFPCVPKMARRVIGWPIDKPATVFGGLTFGGGPIGNYMSHALVSLVEKLRVRGARGLLFANGGFASHNHSIILSRTAPKAGFPQDFDVQAQADAARGPIPPLLETYTGTGTIESYTIFYERDASPRFATLIARTPGGERFLAKVDGDDAASIAFLTDGVAEPVGRSGIAVMGADGDIRWRFQLL